MRKVIWIVAIVALAWTGWWALASATLRSAVADWFGMRTAEGWQADLGRIDGGGYPFTLRAGLGDIAVADPDAGLAIQTDRLDITASALWPGDVEVALDDGPILIASPFGRSTLHMESGVMALALHPGAALELDALGWTSGAWRIDTGAQTDVQADTLTLTMAQTTGPTYEVEARADGFAPGAPTRAQLRLPDSFPHAFDSLVMRATVTFDQPWDRRALDTARPQPRQVALHLAEARWGDLRMNMAADLDVDASGVPEGSLSLQAENWRTMLDLAERSALLPTALRGQAEGILQLLANASGNPDTLDVDLTLRGGAIHIGFIPLGPAPRLILR